jgi:hypothetical protein
LLLDCLEKGWINSRLIASYLHQIFRWSDREEMLRVIMEEKRSLESVRTKVCPFEYLKYLDEVFTQILLMSRRGGEYHPQPVKTHEQVHDTIIVAMLIEGKYAQFSQVPNF